CEVELLAPDELSVGYGPSRFPNDGDHAFGNGEPIGWRTQPCGCHFEQCASSFGCRCSNLRAAARNGGTRISAALIRRHVGFKSNRLDSLDLEIQFFVRDLR